MKEQLLTYESAQVPCNTCGENDPRGREAAQRTGYWLPWLGTPPPDALPIPRAPTPAVPEEKPEELSWWQSIKGTMRSLFVSTI